MIRSTFFGFQISTSGLFAAQKAIDVTGHNISNVNTPGYTRQRLVTTAVDPSYGTTKLAQIGKGRVGMGVQVMSLDQIRDKFLDKQYRDANAATSYWETRAEGLYYVEDIFNNTGDNSLNDILKKFFNSWSEFSEHPSDEEYRTVLREHAITLTTTINDYYNRLVDLQTQQNESIEAVTTDINRIAANIASLNEMIFNYERGGEVANDLRDKRNLLLDELSGYANISYSEDADGRMTVTLGAGDGSDNVLISHKDAYQIGVVADVANNIDPTDPELNNMYSIVWETGPNASTKLDITNGSVKSYLDLRDGDSVDNKGIPYYIKELNKLVESVVTEINNIHMTSGYSMPYTKNGVTYDSRTGIEFFDQTKLKAGNMSISDDIKESVFNICSSDVEVTIELSATGTDYQTGNNKVALAILDLNNATKLNNVDNFEAYIKSFLVTLATETDYANNMTDNQYVMLDNIENNRQSISGVSIDEEASNLVKFQHAYNAAARCMTTMDEMLDKLINGTGRVGL